MRWTALLLATALGCGTRVIELPGPASKDADPMMMAGIGAGAGAPVPPANTKCVMDVGAAGEPCLMCYGPDGKVTSGDCMKAQPPPPLPDCAPGSGPIDGQCQRCAGFTLPGKGVITTCLACKPWQKDPTGGACRTCVWPGLPYEATCQQCLDPNATSPDGCDELLKKVQLSTAGL